MHLLLQFQDVDKYIYHLTIWDIKLFMKDGANLEVYRDQINRLTLLRRI